jgi:hypothetical protein
MIGNPDERPRADDPLRAFGDRLDDLDRRVAELAQIAERAPRGGRRDDAAIGESVGAEERAEALSRRIDLLVRRLDRVTSRVDEIARQVAGHEDALKIVCLLLKQIDDPYGFGESLDERILGCDEPSRTGERSEG